DSQRSPFLSVHPSRGLMDEKFIILVQKALPGFQLTIHASYHCEDGNSWEAFAHYTADAGGTVNVSQDTSLGGTYSGVEAMGLLWSLRPVPGSKPGLRIHYHCQRRRTSRLPWSVGYMAPGVHRIPITEEGLTATLFLPAGPGPFPGLLDLWGGAGQLVEYRAALLASHGIASLALDYLTSKVTVETGKTVDNQYFETAYRVLQKHPQVCGSRIAMLGLSSAPVSPLKWLCTPRCAVCIGGSHVQPVDGSVEQVLGYMNTEKTRFSEQNETIFRDLLLPIPTDPSLKVDVSTTNNCALLLVVGEDDQNWPAAESAKDMKEMMERAGNSHLLTILSYPKTGHRIEPPYTPHVRAGIFRTVDTLMALWGGQTVEHSHAQEDAWKKILVFLRENLYDGTDTGVTTSNQDDCA
uniref:Acyl-CoA thioesterase 19 n=1 Tax=Amphiprion percula TaxID=161767 RepID=A0A3P8TYZ1_AMPPE